MASGTIRVATLRRLVAKIAQLPGFDDKPSDNSMWWVTTPIAGNTSNDRTIIIGAFVGEQVPEGNQAGRGPSADAWDITCGISITGHSDADEALAEVEAAYNAIADMLAADQRLTLPGAPDLGLQSATPSLTLGPGWLESGDVDNPIPFIGALFTVSCAALIHRN